MFLLRRLIAGLVALGAVTVSLGQDLAPDAGQRVDYTGHKVVEVQIGNDQDLMTMMAISGKFLSCSPSYGPMPFDVPPDRMARLEASGLKFRVLHDNLQAIVDAERESIDQQPAGADWFANYKNLAEVSARVDLLVAARPDLAQRISLGNSLEGREIFGLRITSPGAPSDRPAVLFNGCQHAREWMAVMVPMYIAERLIMDYDTDYRVRALVNTAVIYVVPVVNPDGYVYSWSTERYWRKNRRNNGGGSFGVDNNRNWGFQWGGSGASSNPNDETYRGSGPFSEPETQRLRDFMMANPPIIAHIDYHSFSELILWPWGYTNGQPGGADGATFTALGNSMRSAIQSVHGKLYTAGPIGSTLYLASGNAVDWAYGAEGIFSNTIEVRPAGGGLDGFSPPPSEILPTCQENFIGSNVLTEFVGTKLAFDYPNGLPQYVSPNGTTPVAVNIRNVNAALQAGTARQFTRVGGSGSFVEAPLTSLGGGSFQMNLPEAPCTVWVEYYVEAQTTLGETVRSPIDAPTMVHASQSQNIVTIFADDFQTNLGWSGVAAGDDATAGRWNRMAPQQTTTGGQVVQPGSDHTPGAGTICWVTDGNAGSSVGANDVDNGRTTLTSPAFDLSAAADPVISYWRWYTNDKGSAPNADTFRVDITSNGTTWVNVETVGPGGAGTSGGWFFHQFHVTDFVPLSSTIRMRFIAEDIGSGSLVEALVDDFLITTIDCPAAPCPEDLNGDGQVDQADLAQLLAAYQSGPGGDINGDGETDQADLAALLAVYGQACP